MDIRQIRSNDGTGTLSYLIVDDITSKSVIIDPNIEDIQKISYLIDELDTEPEYIIDTHTHVDHISAAGELKRIYDAKLLMHENTKNKWKAVDEGEKFGIGDILKANAALEVDKYLKDGDVIKAGALKIEVLFTPGHTDNHISLLIENKVFTGDLLLIGQAGRSDLPGGSSREQYQSLFNKILKLPDNAEIYPGHDYEENAFALLKDERKNNPFLQKRTEDEYVEFVKDFFPPITESIGNGKKTLQCGTKRVIRKSNEPFESIDAPELASMLKNNQDLYMVDVREPYELLAFGVIPGVYNIPMGQITSRMAELPKDKNAPVVVVCQSGNRSYEVSYYLTKQGYTNVMNLEGGTSGWVYSKDPLVRSYD